jgi:hypothetical protein
MIVVGAVPVSLMAAMVVASRELKHSATQRLRRLRHTLVGSRLENTERDDAGVWLT